ncbi:MAG TPA: AAA family ATPase [Gemmatimonadaceae bacterium]
MAQDLPQELELLIRSRYGLIILDTVEEDRVESILKQIASSLSLHYYSWSRSKGLRRGMSSSQPTVDVGEEAAMDPAKALAIVEREGSGIFQFDGLEHHFDDPLVVSQLRDVVLGFNRRRGAVVITGHDVRLPERLRVHATTRRLAPPTFEDYRALFERCIRDNSARMNLRVDLERAEIEQLVNNLMGLTLLEAEKLITKLFMDDGSITRDDISQVISAKRQAVEQDGLLEYHRSAEDLGQVAGLAGLKEWLDKRRAMVADPVRAQQFGLSFPKGVLLLGVPGCGKSLCAKAVSREWGLPLLKLDPANLYDKYVGDSEKNFKRAMQMAERLAPIVLWIDELEKAFSGGAGEDDGGVSRRVFGTFLSWLQDRKGDVFVVATSNDVAKLPPEFIRKGRFDEVFFVDLPKPDARRAIFEIHLRKRKQEPSAFDLEGLVVATEGFSGAEIEQAIVSGLYSAFAAGKPLSSEILLHEIDDTRPLSQTMAEKLDDLREWARNRAVSAD